MTAINITVADGKVKTATPYHPDFPYRAKKIGGKWSAPVWVFDARDEDRVRELCRDIFGTDGSDSGEMVTVRLTIEDEWSELQGGLFIYGRQIARAWGRDSGAKLGDGVVQLHGTIDSGGSVKNWRTKASAGSVFEIRDVPKKAFEENGIDDGFKAEIVGETIDRDALQAEKTRLLARISEIEALLGY